MKYQIRFEGGDWLDGVEFSGAMGVIAESFEDKIRPGSYISPASFHEVIKLIEDYHRITTDKMIFDHEFTNLDVHSYSAANSVMEIAYSIAVRYKPSKYLSDYTIHGTLKIME